MNTASCNHNWQIKQRRKIPFFERLRLRRESKKRCVGTSTVPETFKYSVYVDWVCSICKTEHTTMWDSRLDGALEPGKPGTISWAELNAIWDLEFKEHQC